MVKNIVIPSNTKNEIVWINTAKAICMLLVFVNHCEFYADGSFFNIRPFYRLFFVNLFFVVSGYLFFRKQLAPPVIDESSKVFFKGTGRKTLINIIFRILIPTLLFGLIFFLPKLIIRGTDFSLSYFIKDVALGNWSWFTSTLFVTESLLVLMLLSRVRNIFIYLVLSILLFCAVAFMPHNTNVVWHWQSGICALSLFVGGGIFGRYETLLDSLFCKPLILMLSLFIYFWIVYFSGWTLKWFVSDFGFTLLGLLVTVFSCILMIYVCKKIPKIAWLEYVGKNSIVFYMLCGGYPNIFAILFQKFSENSTVNVVGSTILSVLLAYITTIIINRYFPFLVDLRLIGKKRT